MVLKSNVSRYCYSYSRKKNVIFKVQVRASTSIVKVFALPFEVVCINQILLGTSVKYYKRNNSRAKYYSSFTTWKCLSCSVVHHLFLVFIIHVKQIMQEFSKLWWPIPPPLPKKIKLKERCVTLIKNPEEISNPTARQILIFISNYRDTCITIVYTELFLPCVIFALLHLQQFCPVLNPPRGRIFPNKQYGTKISMPSENKRI